MKSGRIIALIARIALAVVFIFSGFVKAVDPWGSAIKFGEYFSAFGIEWFGETFFYVLGIGLSTLEMGLGLMLLFGVWLRVASVVTMGFMAFFTVFTLFIALTNPVQDCGCFGEVLKISNWQTFLKNVLLLLPLSIVVWWYERRKPAKDQLVLRNFMLADLMMLVPIAISVWSLMHLPLVDLLPYRAGTDIRAAINGEKEDVGEVETQLIYRDKTTGKEHVFSLSDTTWYDESRWEYVDTKVVGGRVQSSSFLNFSLYDSFGDDVTQEVIGSEHVYLICLASPDLDDVQRASFGKFIQTKRGNAEIFVVSPASMDEPPFEGIPCLSMDGTTFKTMIRAKSGVVELRRGVIERKVNWRDLGRL